MAAKPPGKKYAAIRCEDGSLAGCLRRGYLETKPLITVGSSSARFIVLSVSARPQRQLRPTSCRSCKRRHEPRSKCPPPNPTGTQSSVAPSIYFFDSDGCCFPVHPNHPIMVNVMLVLSQAHHNNEDRGKSRHRTDLSQEIGTSRAQIPDAYPRMMRGRFFILRSRRPRKDSSVSRDAT